MSTEKEMLKRSVAVLTETATNTAKLAKEQRHTADEQNDTAIEQHATAHKLEELSEDLAKSAADLKKNIEAVGKRDEAASNSADRALASFGGPDWFGADSIPQVRGARVARARRCCYLPWRNATGGDGNACAGYRSDRQGRAPIHRAAARRRRFSGARVRALCHNR